VTGTVPDLVLLPVSGLAPGVLIPVARFAGEGNDDQVRPAVAVDILGPASEAFAIGVGAVAVISDLANFMHLPVGRFEPNIAHEDVHFAVPVDVGHPNTLRP